MVCRQLGFTNVEKFFTNSTFGSTTGMYAYAEVSCVGTERQIEDCELTHGHRFDPCLPSDTAGVICSYDKVSESDLDEDENPGL